MRGSAGGTGGALALSRDDCRRTLRRLELEAYASVVSALRAQGHLRDERRKLLEAIRAALHIGSDRHQAEARRASNDELLAAIAEQVCGPNTGLDWAREGRRKIPIMPRGVPQTIYAAIADGAAARASEENELLLAKRARAELDDLDEDALPNETDDAEMDEADFDRPPIVTSDRSPKAPNDEGPPRKKSRSDRAPNATRHATHQKHLDLSQIYTRYSKSHTGKTPNRHGGSAHSLGGKTSGRPERPRASAPKHRSAPNKHGAIAKRCGQVTIPHHRVRSGIKSPTDPHMAGSQALGVQNPIDSNAMKSQTPAFQTALSTAIAFDPPALGRPNAPRVPSPLRTEEAPAVPSPGGAPAAGTVSPVPPARPPPAVGKPCRFVIAKKADGPPAPKLRPANGRPESEPPNAKIVVAPAANSPPRILNSGGKLITTKIVQQIPPESRTRIGASPGPRPAGGARTLDRVLIVPKTPAAAAQPQPGALRRSVGGAALKNVYISTRGPPAAPRDGAGAGDPNGSLRRPGVAELAPKGVVLNSPDGGLRTKTFLLNAKSGRKMVVLPAGDPKTGRSVPLIVKNAQGKPTAMKLVPFIGRSPDGRAKPGVGTSARLPGDDPNPPPLPNSDSRPRVLSNVRIAPKATIRSVTRFDPSEGPTFAIAGTPATPSGRVASAGPPEEIRPSAAIPTEAPIAIRESPGGLDEPGTRSERSPIPEARPTAVVEEGDADSIESAADGPVETDNADDRPKSNDSFPESRELRGSEPEIRNERSAIRSYSSWEVRLRDASAKRDVSDKSDEPNLELEMSTDSDGDGDGDGEDYAASSQEESKDAKEAFREDGSQDEREDTNELFIQHSTINQARRTLLLQDDGSSSNDSSFLLTKNLEAARLELLETSQTSSSAME